MPFTHPGDKGGITSTVTTKPMLHHVLKLGAKLHYTKIHISTFFFNAFFEVEQEA
jgi:hypothetical protein